MAIGLGLFFFELLDSLLQVVFADFLVADSSGFKDEINNLVFIHRRLKLLAELRVLLNKFKELTLLARVLTGLVHDGLGHFLIGNLNVSLLTDISQQQAQLHAALCQLVVLFCWCDLWMIMSLDVRVFLMPQLVGNLACFSFDPFYTKTRAKLNSGCESGRQFTY